MQYNIWYHYNSYVFLETGFFNFDIFIDKDASYLNFLGSLDSFETILHFPVVGFCAYACKTKNFRVVSLFVVSLIILLIFPPDNNRAGLVFSGFSSNARKYTVTEERSVLLAFMLNAWQSLNSYSILILLCPVEKFCSIFMHVLSGLGLTALSSIGWKEFSWVGISSDFEASWIMFCCLK